MAESSLIEWTDATWNPIVGCSVVSPGCTNCYAMRLAGTRLQHHPSRAGLTRPTKAGPVWTGEIRVQPAKLAEPLTWARPRRIFVCAHADLFYELVPLAVIDQVLATIAATPRHTYQVLTKRAARMREILWRLHRAVALDRRPEPPAPGLGGIAPPLPEGLDLPRDWPHTAAALKAHPESWRNGALANLWIGVSAEDAPRLAERLPDLEAIPAAVRFLSLEPLLGPIPPPRLSRIDWVIAGGESGPSARPMHPDWPRTWRDACAREGVPFFFKQWGEWAPGDRVHGEAVTFLHADGRKAGFYEPGVQVLRFAGKKAAGRHLDGQLHDAMPVVA